MSAFDPYSVYSRPSVRTRKGQILRQKPTIFRSTYSMDEINRSKEVLEAYGYYVTKDSPEKDYWESVHGLFKHSDNQTNLLSVNLGDIFMDIENREEWLDKSFAYNHARLEVYISNLSTYVSGVQSSGQNKISYNLLGAEYNNLPISPSGGASLNSTTVLVPYETGHALHISYNPSDYSNLETIANIQAENGYLVKYQLNDGLVYEALQDYPVGLPNITVQTSDSSEIVNALTLSVEVLISCYN